MQTLRQKFNRTLALSNARQRLVTNGLILLGLDPSRTTLIRRRFAAEMKARFKRLSRVIQELVVTDDAFGLSPKTPFVFMQMKEAWRFQTDANKVASYRKWLQQQVDEKILMVSAVDGKPWTAAYVESSYKKGIGRAYDDTRKFDLYEGTREQFLRDAFSAPEMLSKIELVSTRAFTQLQGVTDAMSQQMSRILADGIAAGRGPAAIARELRDNVASISKRRAEVLARTEVINAHSEGQLDSFERLGVEEVGIEAEWTTAGDDRVCERCGAMEGEVMSVKEARGLIPLHPNCRCAWIPVTAKKKEQVLETVRQDMYGEIDRMAKERGAPLDSRRAVAELYEKFGTRVDGQLVKYYRWNEYNPLEQSQILEAIKTSEFVTKNKHVLDLLRRQEGHNFVRIGSKAADPYLRSLGVAQKEINAFDNYLAKIFDKVSPRKIPVPKPVVPKPTKKLPFDFPDEGINRHMDKRFVDWVRQDFETDKEFIRRYLAGEEKILAQISSKEYTVTITDNNRMIYAWNKLPDKPVPSGKWMGWWEKDHQRLFGISEKKYAVMGRADRALLEAKLQLKLYPHEQFFQKYAEFYTPKKYGIWYWEQGGKELNWKKANEIWEKILLEKRPLPAITAPVTPAPVGTAGTKFATAEDYRQYLLQQVEAVKDPILVKEIKRLSDESRIVWKKWTNTYASDPKHHEYADIGAKLDSKLKILRKQVKSSIEIQRKLLDEVNSKIGDAVLDATLSTRRAFQPVADDILSWIPKTRREALSFKRYSVERYTGKHSLNGQYTVNTQTISMFKNSKQVFAHEFGHHVTHQLEGTMRAQSQFFVKRTAGEKVVKLFGDIRGKKDKWGRIDVYAGRVYQEAGGRADEVFSVGIEYLWKNPARFAKVDPEWFNMIVSQLKGIPVK